MTFILTAANTSYALQISDRRLTRFDRKGRSSVYKDEENKAILWDTPNARMAVSYTGIARIRGKPTEQILMSLLGEAGENAAFQMNPATEYLRDALGRTLANLPRSDRRLTVILTGFVSLDGMQTVFPAGCLLTNFQDFDLSRDSPFAWDEFRARYSYPREDFDGPFSMLQFAGNWQAVNLAEVELLRPFLEEGRPAHALVNKAVELYDVWASRSSYIGTQLTSLVIRTADLDQPSWQYHSKVSGMTTYGGSTVVSRPGVGTFMVSDPRVTAEGDGPPSVVPAVPPNNPCPCGSGKRYRRCHGQFNPHQFTDRIVERNGPGRPSLGLPE